MLWSLGNLTFSFPNPPQPKRFCSWGIKGGHQHTQVPAPAGCSPVPHPALGTRRSGWARCDPSPPAALRRGTQTSFTKDAAGRTEPSPELRAGPLLGLPPQGLPWPRGAAAFCGAQQPPSKALRQPELRNCLRRASPATPAAAAPPSPLPGEHSPVRILVVHVQALGRSQELCREKRCR